MRKSIIVAGDNCTTNIDECAVTPCTNGNCKDGPCVNGQCEDGVNDFNCKCEPGYKGKRWVLIIWKQPLTGMPVFSLKAELSLFDVIKKYTHLEVLELLETSKNLLLTQETVTDWIIWRFQKDEVNLFLGAPLKIPSSILQPVFSFPLSCLL